MLNKIRNTIRYIAPRLAIASLIISCPTINANAQQPEATEIANGENNTKIQFAVKNNLLYDLTLTPNLGAEASVGKHSTIQLFYGLNPWKNEDSSLRHWLLQPEYRYWICQPFNGWFFGAHLMGGEFNISDKEFPFGLLPDFQKGKREEGWFMGGGITAGYQWMLSRHWNAEASLGLGYDYIKFDRYKCGHCGELEKSGHTNYFGPTKAALSILYLF